MRGLTLYHSMSLLGAGLSDANLHLIPSLAPLVSGGVGIWADSIPISHRTPMANLLSRCWTGRLPPVRIWATQGRLELPPLDGVRLR